MPGPAGADWHPAARATASHNTLCLAEKSSSSLVPRRRLEALTAAQPIRHPDRVHWHMEAVEGGAVLEASHDGYEHRFGLMHSRRLFLSSDGARLHGRDRIEGSKEEVVLFAALPFAIHFHLHPDVGVQLLSQSEAELQLPGGERWLFVAEGAALSAEESTHFANSSGPRRALQIVLRGTTLGETEVNWAATRREIAA
jgi:uncharacterized heparinase superfamily protein